MAVTFAHAASPGGLNVPPGFEVTSFAGDELAHNIHAMTVNARGEVVVAGPGYVKTLLDTNADGIADGARLFSAFPRSGAHGLFFDGHDLIATGDGTILRLTLLRLLLLLLLLLLPLLLRLLLFLLGHLTVRVLDRRRRRRRWS
jgi:hypothetical protein